MGIEHSVSIGLQDVEQLSTLQCMLEMQVLIENGVDVNSADMDQRTALHVAASRGRAEVAFFLLNTPNVDVNPLDRCTAALCPLQACQSLHSFRVA